MADAWALAGAEIGVVFCTVGLTTGPLWGRRAWGMWWAWDPRLTTTLVLWLIYVSYLLLRRFAAGPQMQTQAAVLGIFGALDVPSCTCRTAGGAPSIPAPVFGGSEGSGMARSHGDSAALEHIGMVRVGRSDSHPALPRRTAKPEGRRTPGPGGASGLGAGMENEANT